MEKSRLNVIFEAPYAKTLSRLVATAGKNFGSGGKESKSKRTGITVMQSSEKITFFCGISDVRNPDKIGDFVKPSKVTAALVN